MLGSDPLAAALGCGFDPTSSPSAWKVYLRGVADAGCSIIMYGPHVRVPADADPETTRALLRLADKYPAMVPMPPETTGKLAGCGVTDADAARINLRVGAYFRHLVRELGGATVAEPLLESGAVSGGVGIHLPTSRVIAALADDAEKVAAWRSVSARLSGDARMAHCAPTLLLPGGGGVWLWRIPSSVDPAAFDGLDGHMEGVRVTRLSSVPIPPSVTGDGAVTRLGPAPFIPDWLRTVLGR